MLRSDNGRMIYVESVWDTGVAEKVYNFRVGDYHTFYVGDPDWDFTVWAHNACEVVQRNGMKKTPVTDKNGNPVIGPNGEQVVIWGTPQNTTGSKLDAHATTVWANALALARTGQYDYLVLNRSWRTALGRGYTATQLRPDIIGVTNNPGGGTTVRAWEVDVLGMRQTSLNRLAAGAATITPPPGAGPMVINPGRFIILP